MKLSLLFMLVLLMLYDPVVYKGDICENDPECNKCVLNLLDQITGEAKTDIKHKNLSFSFPFPKIHIAKHVQGVARIPDWQGVGRMVLTDSGTKEGFRVAFQTVTNAEEALYSTQHKLHSPITFKIRNESSFGNHCHPGGMQAQGDIVAVAMEGGRAKHGAVYFIRITGDKIEYISTLHLDGSQGEPYQSSQNAAATVGFVKLETGNYLLAVSGENHGKQGIWFYESLASGHISSKTQWKYVGFYKPQNIGYGKANDTRFAGAGGGLSLVTDCSGQVYLLAMHGKNKLLKRGNQSLQVFSILKENGKKLSLKKISQQRDKHRKLGINEQSFRWAGGVYITRKGQLAIMNTERQRKEGSNDYVDGDVYLGQVYIDH